MSEEKINWEKVLHDLKTRYEAIIGALEEEIKRLQRYEGKPYAGVF